MIATRTRLMAKEAYQRVAERRSGGKVQEYRTLAHSFPGTILQNGLAQATGFLLAKGKNEHKAILQDLNAVLQAAGVVDTTDGTAFHNEIIGSDVEQSMQLTRHSLAASAWIKRYAQGLLEPDHATDRSSDTERDS